ncbi:MAG: hypothetical protein ACOZQL_00075 [Myxococcota bacterium]
MEFSPASTSPAPPPSARAELAELFAHVAAVDIRTFEDQTVEELRATLLTTSVALLTRGVDVAAGLLAEFDRTSGEPTPELDDRFELAMDSALVAPVKDERTRVADIAFMARIELRQRLERLGEAATTGDGWEVLSQCSSALRRLQKSLSALEHALCEVEGRERRFSYDSELTVSLETRRQYRRLWSRVEELGEPGTEKVRPALRAAGTLIAMLVGKSVYSRIREQDRRQLRAFQERILAWLEPGAGDERAGVRLWQDFAGFVSMLRGINHRQELVEHDRKILRLLRAAADPAKEAPGLLLVLEGLDDALDAARLQGDAEGVRAAVERLATRFEGVV